MGGSAVKVEKKREISPKGSEFRVDSMFGLGTDATIRRSKKV